MDLKKQTHCGMRCSICPPEEYSESTYSFRRQCLTTRWMHSQDDGSLQQRIGQYTPDRLAKTIHLIRDPFSNVISQFLVERELPEHEANVFDKTRNGFRQYCKSIALRFSANERILPYLETDLLHLLRRVPCREYFIRYIEWHNLAFSTADDYHVPTYVLHYEWFASRYNATMTELLQFLELEQKTELMPFPQQVTYDYFTLEERAKLKEAFRRMASFRTWKHLSHYFENDGEATIL